MRRGFLKTLRPPRKPERSPPDKPSSSPRRTRDGGEEAATAGDTMDVETTTVENVSNGGDRVSAVRATRSTDGGAELPLPDNDNDTTADPPSNDPTDEGKWKEKFFGMSDDVMKALPNDTLVCCIPPRPPPRRPGWGRDPLENKLHVVPRTDGDRYRKRDVFLLWPRDPKGKVLKPSERLRCTVSPDGYPWGATLFDFFHVNRAPTVHGWTSVMPSSALLEAIRELGELDAAASYIEWAESEGKPRVEGVANTEKLIECIEWRLRVGVGVGVHNDDEDEATEDGGEEREVEYDNRDTEVDPASIPPPPMIPVTSPFHPSHYPKSWPVMIPFENPHMAILLQERIPLYLLPQTLYVHDPFSLLSARERSLCDTSWTSRPDIIRTYNLKPSESIHKEVEEARRKAEELEEFKSRTPTTPRYTRTKEQIENYEPAIAVPLPPYSRRMTKVEESHLYLSPVAKAGQGHHSIVYRSEWELPRDLFTRPKLCERCFKESADKEIQRLKDTGLWEKMLRAAAWGPTGFTGHKPTQAELDEVSDPTNLERDGEIIERNIICSIPPNVPPSGILQLIDEQNMWDMFTKHKNVIQIKIEGEDEGESTEGSYVPTIRIDPPYENQKTCTHDFDPRTAKFTVVAKLSIEHDHRLVREARNYQRFPEHFFHHYNGYTMINQLRTLVPVNVVVPQFYGYYMPKKDEKENQKQEPYLSPILLLEHCGEPIDPEKLSDEDQDECASLLLRFQRAGWLHESVTPRNFLVQFGKPTEFPIKRQIDPEPSFRLIDFGRSRKYETVEEKRREEVNVLRMFKKLNGRMAVTSEM